MNNSNRWVSILAMSACFVAQSQKSYGTNDTYLENEQYNKEEKIKVGFEKAADRNPLFAQEILAEMYRKGQGIDKNFKFAEKWFEKADLQGLAASQPNLTKPCQDNQDLEEALY